MTKSEPKIVIEVREQLWIVLSEALQTRAHDHVSVPVRTVQPQGRRS